MPTDSATARSVVGPTWTRTEQLLAEVVNVGKLRLWQAGGGKGAKPELLHPPGHSQGDTVGSESLTVEEMRSRLYGAGDAWQPEGGDA